MDSQRWEKIKDLFGRALSLSGEDRNRFLIEACGGDFALRAEVQGLLDHDRPSTFLDQGASRLLEAQRGGNVTFETGEVLAGRFKIARFIGCGGMGEVYEAEDMELRVRVALKTLRPEISSDPQALNRFKQEVQLARRVTHPNVCRMFDIARHQAKRGDAVSSADQLFLTMELLEGESLSERLRRRGLMRVEEAWPIVRQMGEALQSAHEVGVIHRDFKPSNVLLIPSEASSCGIRAVVTDFGLARAATSELSAGGEHSLESLTLSGRLLGTPAYMAPEQIEGRAATTASDIYAFGHSLGVGKKIASSFLDTLKGKGIATMFRKITPWLIFVSCLAVLGSGATTIGSIADHIAVAFKAAILIVFSILVVLNRFRNRRGYWIRIDLS